MTHPKTAYLSLRIARKKSQDEIANSLGISTDLVAKFESGELEPDVECIPKYAELLGVEEETLLNFHSCGGKKARFDNILLRILEKIAAL